MSSVQQSSDPANHATRGETETKLEVVVIPVSDIDRAKDFYASLGWRLDADVARDGFRLIQINPPGSGCSIQFGTDLTPSAPGSVTGLYLIVSDIEVTRADLIARGVKVSEVFHEGEIGGRFHPAGANDRLTGLHPSIRVTARSLHSRTRTATAGCCRRSPPGFPVGSTPPRRRLPRRATCRKRFSGLPRRMGSMRRESATKIRTGRTGTPSTWFASRRERSCRYDL